MHSPKTILIVDKDLGFAFWLGQTLDQVGYQALPARNVADAQDLVTRFGVSIDLLVIDSALPSAEDLIGSLRHSWPHLKVIAVGADEAQPAPQLSANLTLSPPHSVTEVVRAEWLNAIGGLLGPNDAPEKAS